MPRPTYLPESRPSAAAITGYVLGAVFAVALGLALETFIIYVLLHYVGGVALTARAAFAGALYSSLIGLGIRTKIKRDAA